MPWTRAKLEQVAGARLTVRQKLEPVERAALAYARWQGLTDEANIDTEAAKRTLDRALVDLDNQPELWLGLKDLADDLGDAAIIGLMQHSLQRGAEQVRAPDPVPEPAGIGGQGEQAAERAAPRKKKKDKSM